MAKLRKKVVSESAIFLVALTGLAPACSRLCAQSEDLRGYDGDWIIAAIELRIEKVYQLSPKDFNLDLATITINGKMLVTKGREGRREFRMKVDNKKQPT